MIDIERCCSLQGIRDYAGANSKDLGDWRKRHSNDEGYRRSLPEGVC